MIQDVPSGKIGWVVFPDPSRLSIFDTSSKALVTTSKALVSSSFLLLLVRPLLLVARHLFLVAVLGYSHVWPLRCHDGYDRLPRPLCLTSLVHEELQFAGMASWHVWGGANAKLFGTGTEVKGNKFDYDYYYDVFGCPTNKEA